jgi:hypothetical protein
MWMETPSPSRGGVFFWRLGVRSAGARPFTADRINAGSLAGPVHMDSRIKSASDDFISNQIFTSLPGNDPVIQ